MISLFHRSPSIVHRRARPLQRNIILERVYFGNDAIVKCYETDVKLSRAARYEIPRSCGSDVVLSVVAITCDDRIDCNRDSDCYGSFVSLRSCKLLY